MSVNCIRCVVNDRTGIDLLCDDCRDLERPLKCSKCLKPVKRRDTLQNSRVGLVCPHCGGEMIRADKPVRP